MISFGKHNISVHEQDGRKYWMFNCAMIGVCRPVFDDLDSNVEVERRLRQDGIIDDTMTADSETCALIVYFRQEETAQVFLHRLNKYIRDWGKLDVPQPSKFERFLHNHLEALMRIAHLSKTAWSNMNDGEMLDSLEEASTIAHNIFEEARRHGFIIGDKGWQVGYVEPTHTSPEGSHESDG